MQFKKYEAIAYLLHCLGSIDGNFSNEESGEVAKSSYIREVLDSYDSDLLIECLKNGTLNINSACNLLKDLEFKEKIEIFAAFILIIYAEEPTREEAYLLAEYQECIGFEDLDLAIVRRNEIQNSFN